MDSSTFVGIKFGSFSTTALVYDTTEGVRELCPSCRSSVCVRGNVITHIGNPSATCVVAQDKHSKALDLTLLLLEESHIEDMATKYFLPYKLANSNIIWNSNDITFSVDTILSAFFEQILHTAKAGNNLSSVHVVVGVSPYIKEKGKLKLEEILLDTGFTTCKVYDCLELLSVLMEVDQIQSKTNYTIIYDIGYHHSTVAIVHNPTGYIIHRKDMTLGGADIICSLMKFALKDSAKSIQQFSPTKVDKLRSSCSKTLVNLSTSLNSTIEVDEFYGEDNDLTCPCSRKDLSIIVDQLYGNFFSQLELENKIIPTNQLRGSTVLLTSMTSHVVHIEQKISEVAKALGFELNKILVRDKAVAIGAIAKFPLCRQGKERRELKIMKEKNQYLEEVKIKLQNKNDEMATEIKNLKEDIKKNEEMATEIKNQKEEKQKNDEMATEIKNQKEEIQKNEMAENKQLKGEIQKNGEKEQMNDEIAPKMLKTQKKETVPAGTEKMKKIQKIAEIKKPKEEIQTIDVGQVAKTPTQPKKHRKRRRRNQRRGNYKK